MAKTPNPPKLPLLLPLCCGALSIFAAETGVLITPDISPSAGSIASIAVRGNRKATPELIVQESGLKAGDDLAAANLGLATEKLWKTGLFEDIRFSMEDEADPRGKRLIIEVRENPAISKVEYRGAKNVGIAGIQERLKALKLNLSPKALYNPGQVGKIKSAILDYCQEKGFPNPVVECTLESGAEGIATLVFQIHENAKIVIHDIQFTGMKAFTPSKISGPFGVLKNTRKHGLFSFFTSKDLLVQKHLETDQALIKKAYLKRGYKDIHVGAPIVAIQDHTKPEQQAENARRLEAGGTAKTDIRATVTFPITEGESYQEGVITFKGNEQLFRGKKGERALLKHIQEARKKHYPAFSWFRDTSQAMNMVAIDEGLAAIQKDYAKAGYIRFHADTQWIKREDDGVKKLDALITLHEDEAFTIRRIDFQGNRKTRDKILRRAMRVRETETFNLDQYRQSFIGLSQLGFFKVQDLDVKIDPKAPVVDITVKGEEAALHDITFQGGYDQVQKFIVAISLNTRNLFGNGETLGLGFNNSAYQRSFSLNFAKPYVFDRPYSFFSSLADRKEEYDALRTGGDYAFDIRTQELNLGSSVLLGDIMPKVGSHWFKWTRYGLGYSLKKHRISKTENPLFDLSNNQRSASINQSLIYSTLNSPFNPTQGFKLGATLDVGGWQFSDEKFHLRLGLEMAKLWQMTEKHAIGLRLRYHQLTNLGKDEIPIWLLYRPGGENSIRGYRPSSVGSVLLDANGAPLAVGGNRQLVANVEYQMRATEQLGFALFFDAGNAWLPGEKLFNRDKVSYRFNNVTPVEYRNPALVRSMGVELRVFLPISPAPIRFIWAKKLDIYPTDLDKKSQFQFTIGSQF